MRFFLPIYYFIYIISILAIITLGSKKLNSKKIDSMSPSKAAGSTENKLDFLAQTLSLLEPKDPKQEIVVAIIDTGIDITHPSLKNNIWKNQGEMGLDKQGRQKSSNGIDDDKNGHIDDLFGWNFVKNNHQILDRHGHGTHIAGIIAAHSSPNKESSSPRIRLMALKYYDSNGFGDSTIRHTIEAIEYAIKMGAHIINYSSGGLKFSPREMQAIFKASNKGVLFVAAAGNESLNTDVFGYYPATYPVDNILSVGATDQLGRLIPSSNYGKKTVDIAAPGNNILSTIPGGGYGYMTGTSQAAAYVTRVASLMLSLGKEHSPKKLIEQIVMSGDSKHPGKYIHRSISNINPQRALSAAKSLALQEPLPRRHLQHELTSHQLQNKFKQQKKKA